MIAQLSGTLVEKGIDHVVVDVGGVGYLVSISLMTLQALPPLGAELTLKTNLQVREDAMQLYGFITDEERRAFELCISVSGVGPRLALATLSGMSPQDLAEAVGRGDVARLCKLPGIGKKTAERLVVELRDKFEKAGIRGRAGMAAPLPRGAQGGMFTDVVGALTNLGYRAQDAEQATERALAESKDSPIDVVLRNALRLLKKE